MSNKKYPDSPYLTDIIPNDNPVPKYLYKHRFFDEKGHHIDALKKKSIWLADATTLDDPSEAIFQYRYKESDLANFYKNNITDLYLYILKAYKINHAVTKEEIEEFKNFCFTARGRLIKEKFYTFFEAKGVNKEDSFKFLNIIEKYKREIIRDKLNLEFFKKSFENMNNALGKTYISCSFTECKMNQQMWAQYSNHHSGFLIEYDISSLDKENIKFFSKIKYDNKPEFSIFEFLMLFSHQNDTDILETLAPKLANTLLTKDLEWVTQKEWRFIPFSKKSGLMEFPYISAIYLGHKITKENREIILGIAKSENYKVYDLVRDSIDGKMKYIQYDL